MARLANALVRLRDQVNANYPNRSKVSDGWIGDSAHAAVASDHNPNSVGVVTALDLTNHPGYFDAHALADRLITNRHPNLKYVISDRRIAGAWSGWRWQAYNGSNPHDKHIHVSVGVGNDGASQQPYDDTTNWNIGGSNVSEIITDQDKDILRIGHSEIGGWDINKTHRGDYDGLFLGAWQGKPVKDFVRAQWKAGAPHRDLEAAQKNFYNAWKDKVAELSSRPTKEQLQAINTSLEAERKKVEEAEKKLAEELAKDEATAEENVRGFFGKLIDLIFRKG